LSDECLAGGEVVFGNGGTDARHDSRRAGLLTGRGSAGAEREDYRREDRKRTLHFLPL
jgi:hypothetical protein